MIEDTPPLSTSASRVVFPSPWNVPYPRNPFFLGRDDELAQVHRHLQGSHATTLSQPQAISGLGGIGKTQIAVEFAYRHRHEYQRIFWVRADTRESLVSSYISIAGLLNLPEKDAEAQQMVIRAVQNWLQTHGSWLLILDNADELALVHEFLPLGLDGHILLTTRAQVTGKLAYRIEVEIMPQDIGALFLLRRAKIIAPDVTLSATPPDEEGRAREICEKLGGLPLALDQAGAYIEKSQCSLSDYQQRFQARSTLLLKQRRDLGDDHTEPVATTWSLSFEKVEQTCPAAGELLRFCAFLAADAIPEEIITQGSAYLGTRIQSLASDPFLLDEAIGVLRAYSLLRRDRTNKTLSIHRLVQVVIRDAMEDELRRIWAERAVLVLNQILPSVSFTTWPQWALYLSHALVCASWVTSEQIKRSEAMRLLYNAGCYLIERDRISEAYPLLQQAFVLSEHHLRPEHTNVASTGGCFARGFLEGQGKYEDVEQIFARMLSSHEKDNGSNHPEVATDLNNLANLYKIQGKYAEAIRWFQEALTIRERTLGKTHLDTAQSMWCLAYTYRLQKQYVQAEPLYKWIFSLYRQELGTAHPDTQTILAEYVALLRAMGHDEQADSLERQNYDKRSEL